METLNSVLRNLFPFKGYKFVVLESKNVLLIGLKSRRKCGICPSCSKRCSNVETEYERRIRDIDTAQHKCYLVLKEKKIRCNCGYRGMEKLDFVSKSRRVTTRMETYIVSLAEQMCLKAVAEATRLDWKTVKQIDRDYIKTLLPEIFKLELRRIAIDEIAIMKGHKYFTILRDYDTGIAILILFGRRYETLANGLATLGTEKLANIAYVSLDMWDPYIKAIQEKCPNAQLIFDKFHVIKKVSEALDKVRKKEFAEADKDERIMMKHKRFVILKRKDNLETKQKKELKIIMQENERLYKAYLLKEQILSIFEDKESTFKQIQKRIFAWFENIVDSGIDEFNGVVKMMKHYLKGILNYFRYGMTNAIAEGLNTKINIIKRRAFGLRDIEYFMLKIYQSSLRRLA